MHERPTIRHPIAAIAYQPWHGGRQLPGAVMKPGRIVLVPLVAVTLVVLVFALGWNNGMPPGEPPVVTDVEPGSGQNADTIPAGR